MQGTRITGFGKGSALHDEVVLMLGIIGGTSLLFSTLPSLEKRTVSTPFGSAEILSGDIVMLMRHQHGLPPHRINHRAHLAALAIAGVDRIVAFGSSGSLKPKIAPGSLLIPTDYISLTDIPSIHDHEIEHVRPELSKDLSQRTFKPRTFRTVWWDICADAGPPD